MQGTIYKHVILITTLIITFFNQNLNEEPKPLVTFYIDKQENISVSVLFDSDIENSFAENENGQVFLLIFLPFEITSSTKIESPNNVLVSLLSQGTGYTIFSVIVAKNSNDVLVNFQNIGKLLQDNERSRLEINLSYEYLDPFEKQLLQNEFVISNWNYKIVLPQKFSESDISLSPSNKISIIDEGILFLSKDSLKEGIVSIKIPSLNQTNISVGILIIIGLVSILSIFFIEIREFRNRRIASNVVICIVSLLILGVSIYYYIQTSYSLTFLVTIAFAIPHSLSSFVISIYLLFAKKFEAKITGKVTINGNPIDYANVILKIVYNGNKIRYQHIHKLNDGEYTFYVWLYNSNAKVKISVDISDTTPYSGRLITIQKGKYYPQRTIDL